MALRPEKGNIWQTVFQAFDPDESNVYHSRRPHKKSRAGCLICKKRRVKVRTVLHPADPDTDEVSVMNKSRPA